MASPQEQTVPRAASLGTQSPWETTPSGRGRPALDDSIPEIDPRDFERIGALLAKYRLEEAGPPLQPAG